MRLVKSQKTILYESMLQVQSLHKMRITFFMQDVEGGAEIINNYHPNPEKPEVKVAYSFLVGIASKVSRLLGTGCRYNYFTNIICKPCFHIHSNVRDNAPLGSALKKWFIVLLAQIKYIEHHASRLGSEWSASRKLELRKKLSESAKEKPRPRENFEFEMERDASLDCGELAAIKKFMFYLINC